MVWQIVERVEESGVSEAAMSLSFADNSIRITIVSETGYESVDIDAQDARMLAEALVDAADELVLELDAVLYIPVSIGYPYLGLDGF